MIGALMARQLMRWGGPDAFVRKLGYRQRGTVYVDDSIVYSAAGSSSRATSKTATPLVTCSIFGQQGGRHRDRTRRLLRPLISGRHEHEATESARCGR